MALDPRFVTAPSLQMVFRDKDTGLPLRSGYIKFYQDIARTVPKSVYKISGTPPNYSYTDIGNVVTLTGIGTFSDNLGTDIIPYYFPFDGTPNDTGNITDLYWIQVYSAGNVLQFTREGWPNFVDESLSSSNSRINYIANGQFLAHTDIAADILGGYEAGEIRADVTEIAQGNITFERPTGATSKDFVIFDRIGDYVDNPTGSPRYSVNIRCESIGAGIDFKDVRFKFFDVNKFASLEQEYTFSITGKTNAGSSVDVSVWLIKNFGTGGSTETEEEIGTCTLTNSYGICNTSFIFGTNIDETIGPNNDDFLQIAIRFPTNEIFNINIDNAILAIGRDNITAFPVTTDSKFLNDSLVPDNISPVGNDLGLPMVSTLSGAEYDHSVVGDVTASVRTEKKWNHLCDGRQLLTSGYQDTGVPNSRLQAILFQPVGIPMFGTGAQFLTALNNNTPLMVIHNNTAGAVTAAADGAIPTGFNFSNVHVGDAGYGVSSFWYNTASFAIWNNALGAVTACTLGTSGFSFDTAESAFNRTGTTLTAQITSFTTIIATTLSGKYFTFVTPSTTYYVWFKVDGVGADPAPGGTGILVNLLSTDIARYVAQKISTSLNGYQVDGILATAATPIPAGSYFNLHAIGGSTTYYYVWYSKDNAGVDPAPVGGTGIKVSILSTDNQTSVQNKTVLAINMMYFAVPDFRGQIIKGYDPLQTYDLGGRFSFYQDDNNGLGSFQLDSNLSHSHVYVNEIFINSAPGGGAAGVASGTQNLNTTSSGGYSSNPYNVALNYFIHY